MREQKTLHFYRGSWRIHWLRLRKPCGDVTFAHSPYRTKIIALASGAAAALVHLEQGELEKMREEILTALEATAK